MSDLPKITTPKEIVQSYMLTTAGRDWNKYAEKILLKIVELAQNDVKGIDFTDNDNIRKYQPSLNYPNVKITSDGDAIVTIPLRELLPEGSKNNTYVRKAITELQKKIITWNEYETDQNGNIVYRKNGKPKIVEVSVQLIGKTKADLEDKAGFIKVKIDVDIWKAMLDFSRGFRAFELDIAMKLKHKYSLRIYQLVSRQKNPLSFSLDKLITMWGLNKESFNLSNFEKRVLKTAKKELDSCSPWTFEYVKDKAHTRGELVTGITFIPIHQPQFDNAKTETNRLLRQYRGAFNNFGLTKDQVQFLSYKFGFTEQEIKNNHAIFEDLCTSGLDVDDVLMKIAVSAYNTRPQNPQGYAINAIKDELKKII